MNAFFFATLGDELGFTIKDVDPHVVTPLLGLVLVQWIMLAVGVALLLALGVIAWLLVHLLGQNGRMLVRFDQIEAALENAGIDTEELQGEEVEGLPIGSPAPAFNLARLSGKTESLDELRKAQKPVILIFSDPGCGPCNALMPEVNQWSREHQEVQYAVISRGSLEENRRKASEYGFDFVQVLVQQGSEVADSYHVTGTPMAVLVQPDGTIGSGLAAGADNVRALVRRAWRRQAVALRQQVDDSPVEGLERIGKDAPLVELKNLAGDTVRLADFAGHPTAVLFWNPYCGFCRSIVNDLKAWEAEPPKGAPRLLIVSTEDVQTNREIGLTSPTVLDSGFTVGSAFGATGTPSAVLVGADGKIASGLAVGGPMVLSLLGNESPSLLDAPAAEPEAPQAVPVGGRAPRVQLPDLDGKRVDLEEIRNGRTALLFWNPGCGFCQRLIPELKEWEADRGDGSPRLVLISTGLPEENRNQGFGSAILLDGEFSTAMSFGASGTPSAILLDAEGNVSSSLAVGGPNVMELLRS